MFLRLKVVKVRRGQRARSRGVVERRSSVLVCSEGDAPGFVEARKLAYYRQRDGARVVGDIGRLATAVANRGLGGAVYIVARVEGYRRIKGGDRYVGFGTRCCQHGSEVGRGSHVVRRVTDMAIRGLLFLVLAATSAVGLLTLRPARSRVLLGSDKLLLPLGSALTSLSYSRSRVGHQLLR